MNLNVVDGVMRVSVQGKVPDDLAPDCDPKKFTSACLVSIHVPNIESSGTLSLGRNDQRAEKILNKFDSLSVLAQGRLYDSFIASLARKGEPLKFSIDDFETALLAFELPSATDEQAFATEIAARKKAADHLRETMGIPAAR